MRKSIAAVLLLFPLKGFSFGLPTHLADRTTAPSRPSTEVEIAGRFAFPPGHVSVSKTGRIFMDAGIFEPGAKTRVYEFKNGRKVAFPAQKYQDKFISIHGIYVDKSDRLWILDHGNFHFSRAAHLFGYDINTGREIEDYEFPIEVAGVGEMLNDVIEDPYRNKLYISDTGPINNDSGIIVFDIASRKSHRVLAHHSTLSASDNGIWVEGKPFTVLGFYMPRYGLDGIALDQTGTWFYYSAFNSGELYRVNVAAMTNPLATDSDVEKTIEKIADTTMSDGMWADPQGRIYMSDVEHSAIMRVGTDGSVETVFKDPLFRWPTAFSPSPDGYVYFTSNALNDIILQSRDKVHGLGPFFLFRFRP